MTRKRGDESYYTRIRKDADLDRIIALPVEERAYIAGFFDGEGSVGIYRNGRMFAVSVTFVQKNPAILLWIQEIFGGVLVATKPEHSLYSTEMGFQLRYTSKDHVTVILRTLRPYIRVKKEQVDAVFNFMQTPDMSIEDKTNIVELVKTLKRA